MDNQRLLVSANSRLLAMPTSFLVTSYDESLNQRFIYDQLINLKKALVDPTGVNADTNEQNCIPLNLDGMLCA